MKKYILITGVLVTTLLLSATTRAQKSESRDKKTKEIIIRENGDKNTKTTVEIDGDQILVNGKPLADYHGDDVSIIKRDFMRDRSRNFLYSPDNEDMDVHVFDNDNDNDNDNELEVGESRAFLGVVTEKSSDGVTITSVVKGSSAEKAGLQKDDIITQVGDKKIATPGELMEAVRSFKPDDNVKVDYLRNNKKKDVKVKLGVTNEKNRKYFFKYDNRSMNGDGFNFKMPSMPKMPPMPNINNSYNYRFWNNNNPKIGLKIEDTENSSGVKILDVEAGSAADKAGLKKDDIITEVNGEKIDNVDEMRDQIGEGYDKGSLNVKAKRNNADMNFEVKIPKELNKADL